MTHWTRILTGSGALSLLATPAWAHPASTPHAHAGELIALLASAAVLGAVLLLHRSRSRAG